LRARADEHKSCLNIKRGQLGNRMVPLEGHTAFNPKTRERILDKLLERSLELDEKTDVNQFLYLELEKQIHEYCEQPEAAVVLLRYLGLLTYREISERVNYSISHVRRLHMQGLEQFGEKMSTYEH